MTVPVFQCVVQDSDAPQHFLFFFRFHTGTARYARLVTPDLRLQICKSAAFGRELSRFTLQQK
jgi:hypothetical protein